VELGQGTAGVPENASSSTGNAVNIHSVDRYDAGRAVRWTALAPFLLLRAIFRGAFRFGFFFLFTGPVTAIGLLFGTCALIVMASMGYGIYQYNTDPIRQLHSKQVVLTWARQSDREIDSDRRKRGLPPMAADERRAPPIERQIAEFEARIGLNSQATPESSGPAATP
jgi:hypothetical protein